MAKLRRALGLFETTMYGIGIILGAGIYVLIGKAAGVAGNSVWIAFLVAGLIAGITGLSYAELSGMFPKSAASYVYTRHALKQRFVPFVVGWLAIYASVAAAATVSLGFAGYMSVLTGWSQIPIAIVLIAILSVINFWGIKESAKMNILFTSIEILGVLVIIALAFGFGHFGYADYFEMPAGMTGIFTAAVLIFFAYLGFEDLVNVSEET